MLSSKRTKDLDSSSESKSSDAKPEPKPNRSYRPLQASGVGALSSAQPSAAFKRATNTPRQPSSMKTKPNAPLTSRDTPILELASRNKAKDKNVIDSSDDDSSSLPESPFFLTRQKTDNRPMELSDDEAKRLHTTAGRTKAWLERDVNTVRSGFEGHQAWVDKRLEHMEDCQARFKKQQDLLLEKLDVLIDRSNEAPGPKRSIIKDEEPASTSYFATAKNIQISAPLLTAIILTSFGEALTRKVAKAGLGGVTKLTSNVPEFYYKHGQPDYFPAQFTSNDSYCKPYAHWDESFAANHHWFVAFITPWRSMIPPEGSEFAAACKKFTDRQILVLLHDGPFSPLSQAWKRENDPEQAEGNKPEKNAKKRDTGRKDSKMVKRQQYRPEIPQVAGPGWEAAWSRRVVSPEGTDDEGGNG
ncbi:hypothetical protein RSOLAG22IIIB_07045 [Rhizoctonia solani]|uniref:Uncharacterized protein n=1 Tax=Rhizoctonia solani TaxID=456999 RepID=A0A0K6GIM7_9AGAM|nr:hypothetical protein RSOLAG22IIIB_07045 [Rhizoctonia solani]